MGLIKKNGYSAGQLQISAIKKAMGHPARQLIIDLVLSRPLVRSVDLPSVLNLSGASVQRHLNCLYSAGVLRPIYHVHYAEVVVVHETFELLQRHTDELCRRAGLLQNKREQ